MFNKICILVTKNTIKIFSEDLGASESDSYLANVICLFFQDVEMKAFSEVCKDVPVPIPR